MYVSPLPPRTPKMRKMELTSFVQPEHAGLLGDHSAHTNYGYNPYPPSPSAAAQGMPDPQNLVHQREYLDRLVAQTSENLIDIFAPPMLTGAPASMSITPSSRGEWYRSLLERTSPPSPVVDKPEVLDPTAVGEDERQWLDGVVKKGEEAVKELARVKEVGALVVGLDMDL